MSNAIYVKQLFEGDRIDLDAVKFVAHESSYWAGCSKFIVENWDRDLSTFTQRQFTWMHKILEDMVEMRINNKLW